MKKIVFVLLVLGFSLVTFGQEQEKETPKWTKKGHLALLFSQNAFENWAQGGQDALAGNLKINYDINYKEGKNDWITKFFVGYGLTHIDNVTKKSEDIFEVNSIYGRNINELWKYSFYANFKTQFTPGYDYTTSPFTKISNAFAPAFLSAGPGIFYKKSDDFYMNFAPVTSKIVIVTDPDLNALGLYGVKPGESIRYELGMNYQLFFRIKLMENVSLENMLNLFSNYLDNPQNIDVDNKFSLHMKVNKYLSAGLTIHTLYDDNTFPGTQISEVFGLEFGLDF